MSFVLIVIVVWLAAMACWFFLSRSFRSADADKIRTRLIGGTAKKVKAASTGPALFTLEESSKSKFTLKLLSKYKVNDWLRVQLEQAGLRWNVAQTVHGCVMLFVGGFFLAKMLLPDRFVHLSWLAALLLGALPIFYIRTARTRRVRKFEEVFPDSLEFVARSMRAGHAFSVSLEMLHREFPEPLSSEFRRTFEEHNLGLPLDTALEKLAARVPLLDVQFFVSAVMLQKRTGGNLAEILDKLAYVIRERFKLRGKIRAISAHGKITGVALTCIPVGVGALMSMTNPSYLSFFFNDETGTMLMGVAVLFQAIGYLIIRKIVKIEV